MKPDFREWKGESGEAGDKGEGKGSSVLSEKKSENGCDCTTSLLVSRLAKKADNESDTFFGEPFVVVVKVGEDGMKRESSNEKAVIWLSDRSMLRGGSSEERSSSAESSRFWTREIL